MYAVLSLFCSFFLFYLLSANIVLCCYSHLEQDSVRRHIINDIHIYWSCTTATFTQIDRQSGLLACMSLDSPLPGSRATAVAGAMANCSAVGTRGLDKVPEVHSSLLPFRSSPTTPHTVDTFNPTSLGGNDMVTEDPATAAAAEPGDDTALTVYRGAVTGWIDANHRSDEARSTAFGSSETECDQPDARLALQGMATNGGIVDLSNRHIASLFFLDIDACATHLTQLNLSSNALVEIPDEIGRLRQLQYIDLSKNKLQALPPAVAFWQHLRTMDVSSNFLVDLPSAVRHLDRLEVLNLANNILASVPSGICRLQTLRLLNLSHNPINVLPARMFIHGGTAAPNRGKLEVLLLEGCPLIKQPAPQSYQSTTDTARTRSKHFPSLVDTVLHRMIVSNSKYPFELPEHLQRRLKSFIACNYCHALFPAESGISRQSFVCRDKIELPVEYSLCKAHWNDEQSRIASLFAPRMPECAQDYFKAKKSALALTRSTLVDGGCSPNSGCHVGSSPPQKGLWRRMANVVLHRKKHSVRGIEASVPGGQGRHRSSPTIWQVFEDDLG